MCRGIADADGRPIDGAQRELIAASPFITRHAPGLAAALLNNGSLRNHIRSSRAQRHRYIIRSSHEQPREQSHAR